MSSLNGVETIGSPCRDVCTLKVSFKWTNDLEDNMGEMLQAIDLSKGFLGKPSEAQAIKAKETNGFTTSSALPHSKSKGEEASNRMGENAWNYASRINTQNA